MILNLKSFKFNNQWLAIFTHICVQMDVPIIKKKLIITALKFFKN